MKKIMALYVNNNIDFLMCSKLQILVSPTPPKPYSCPALYLPIPIPASPYTCPAQYLPFPETDYWYATWF